MAAGEFAFIGDLRSRLAADPRVPVGVGDDAALLRTGPGTLVTVDMLLEGVHFRRDEAPERVGRKAMNVNLSDIAAMGGWPVAAVVAVGLPPGRDAGYPARLLAGLRDAAAAFDVALIGGDTNSSKSGLVIAVTVLGEPGPKGPILRSGARPGDFLWVTGSLGYSILGKHLDFVPRLRESRDLVVRFSPTSLLDISDGIAGDLFHLANESRVGAEIWEDRIPIAAGLPDGGRQMERALRDGEDFELLFTLSPEDSERLEAEGSTLAGTPATRIGAMVAEAGVRLRRGGQIVPMAPGGFVHDWK